MGWLSAIGLGSFAGVSFVLGLRLLLLAARTRRLPELAMGSAFFLAGSLGYGVMVATVALAKDAPGWMALGIGTGRLCINAGSAALALFTWRVFRPAYGAPVFGALLALMAAGFAGEAWTRGFAPGLHGFWAWLGFAGRIACFAWASAEAFAYHARMRRQVALGLARREEARRFLDWGVGCGAATLIFVTTLVRVAVGDDTGSTSATATVPTAVFGLTAAAFIWRTFSPRGRAAADQPARS